MSAQILKAVLFSIAPAFGMVTGGAIATWRNPDSVVRSYIQHLAAGIVFAAVGVEILPEVMHRGNPVAATAGFAVGVDWAVRSLLGQISRFSTARRAFRHLFDKYRP